MSFGWLGTFRQGSWQAYRRFILNERRDVSARISTIRAELKRIGQVVVLYGSSLDDDGVVVVTEERIGFQVTTNSSLGKLFQVYIALGGNPFDISLFLTPDSTVITDPDDPDRPAQNIQPYGGVVAPKSGSYSTGDEYEGGYLEVLKYVPARVGGRKELDDASVANLVSTSRKWANKEIKYKKHDLEARIIKLCDLREQLFQEMEHLTMALAGLDVAIPMADDNQFDKDLTVAGIVAAIDAIFYQTSEEGVPDFNTPNEERLGNHPYLLDDLPGEENTAL